MGKISRRGMVPNHYLALEVGKLIAEARAEVAISAGILDYYATTHRKLKIT